MPDFEGMRPGEECDSDRAQQHQPHDQDECRAPFDALRGGATQLVEGGPEPKRVVILEFSDTAAVKRWYDSPEYQKILPLRLANSTGRAFIVEGAS